MSSRSIPTVVLLSAPGTLHEIDPLVRRERARLVRLPAVVPVPTPPTVWLKRLDRTAEPDTIVVTSRNAVRLGVLPWKRVSGRFPASFEFWAVGPGTAQELRRAGIRRVRNPRTVGAMAVARSLRRRRPRTVVYLRSDFAGPQLPRTLRHQGHRVVDLVVYRLREPPRLTARARHELASADLLVVTSPSGLSYLRRRLDRPTFSRILETRRLVVLGERSRRAARGLGFQHISVAPSTTAQRFTRHLLREIRDART